MTSWTDGPVHIIIGDALERLGDVEPGSVQCAVTSPPYWGLRDYHVEGQLGLEDSPDDFVAVMVATFALVRRALRQDGTLWLNLGDSYAGALGAQARGNRTGDDKSTLERGLRTKGREIVSRRRDNALIPRSDFKVAGLKPKDMVGMPWRVAFALQADGWYLRSEIIWHKPNAMPESVQDRPTKAHETLFLLTRSERYYYDAEAIREAEAPATAERYEYEFKDRYAVVADAKGYRGAFGGKDPKWRKNHKGGPGPEGHARLVDHVREARANGADHDNPLGPGGRNKRSVWTIPTQPYPEAHFATFPEALVEPCIKAGSREGDTVLDPFAGSGTTLAVARRLGRKAIGIELQPDYLPMIQKRVRESAMPLLEVMSGSEEAAV